MKKTIIAAGVLAATLVGAAHAGVYVGAGVNYNEVTEFSVPDVRSSGDAKTGFGVNLGYSHNFGKVMVAGEFAMQTSAGASKLYDTVNDLNMKAELENARSVNVKLGYEVAKGVTPYIKLGRGNVDMKLSALGASSTSNFDTKTIGAGVSYDVSNSFAVVGEYRQLSNLDGTGSLTASTFDLGLAYKF